MDTIQLLYAKNVIARENGCVQQRLTFFMRVKNKHYDKQVDVVWAGEEGEWHTLSATYHSMQGNQHEYWQATIDFNLTEKTSLPGNIRFGLRFRVGSEEYWDNNQDQNFFSEADSGVYLPPHGSLQNIDFASNFTDDQLTVPVSIAVKQSFQAKKVSIHWTTDHWQTTQMTPCDLSKMYWEKHQKSNARNPNQYRVELWSGCISSGDAFSLEYIICCESEDETWWENNFGDNYSFQRDELKILILNLHCYQEDNQDEKFSQIARAINELQVDIVCLQEVAEYWRDGEGDWESNSAKIINDRLPQPFYLHTDWSHLGFDKYREGVAILSRYPLSDHDSRYVSESHDIYSIHSRKVVMAKAHIPFVGQVNIFSAHLSWLEDGFAAQFQQLHDWADSHQTEFVKATLLCGDFNITAGSTGYELVVDSNNYDDQYLAANEQGVFEQIFRVNDEHWQNLLADDYRIDYIFKNKTSELKVTSAKVVFTEQDYGIVSDHCGYFMTFIPSSDHSLKEGE